MTILRDIYTVFGCVGIMVINSVGLKFCGVLRFMYVSNRRVRGSN